MKVDAHFQERRFKGDSLIQPQVAEDFFAAKKETSLYLIVCNSFPAVLYTAIVFPKPLEM